MKNLLIIISILTGLILTIWIFLIFPYPSCSKSQIEVTKQELIDGILEREIKLRELYAKANGNSFVQTKEFSQQLQKERKKFYKYCDNEGSTEFKNNYCEITTNMNLFFIDRYSTYTLKYHFDKESKRFFNQVTTYWGHKKERFSSTMFGTHWEDRFWRAVEDKQLKELHPTNVVGYSAEYSFFNCNDSKEHWWPGFPMLELLGTKNFFKKNLVFISSFIPEKEGSLSGWGKDINIGIKTYIKKEEKK